MNEWGGGRLRKKRENGIDKYGNKIKTWITWTHCVENGLKRIFRFPLQGEEGIPVKDNTVYRLNIRPDFFF